LKGKSEQLSWVILFPILAAPAYYLLPLLLQKQVLIQMVPQLLAYLGFAAWSQHNTHVIHRLGLAPHGFWLGLRRGSVVGIILGTWNTLMILWVIPMMGGEIAFLQDTPHAKVPTFLMVPWGILSIAVAVELNFRGFLLGRLLVLTNRYLPTAEHQHQWTAMVACLLSIGISSFLFSFDPFMVSTFHSLHWIALWDGCIWGWLWVRFRNLYTVMIAHTVEVILLYVSLKMALT